MKYIKHLLVAFGLFIVLIVKAEEGMWLPQLLQALNEKQMKSLGMKISAKDIYNINAGSLKDAIVSFGGFCTGEVISSKGLVLTNHHCGFDAIQNHSTLEHNYIRDGFWAKSLGEEIPNPTEDDIKNNISNICRCGTHPRIIKAIQKAAILKQNPNFK